MATKQKRGTKFCCVLVFETQVDKFEEMAAVMDAITEAQEALEELGDCHIAGDRFLPPSDDDDQPEEHGNDTPPADDKVIKLS